MDKLKEIFDLFKTTFQEWRQDQAPQIAAAMAYYTVFALGPLLLIVVSVAGLLYGEQAVQGQIVEQIDQTVGQQGAEMIQTMIEGAERESSGILATIIGIVTLILSAAGLFTHLQRALNAAWDVPPEERGGGIVGMIKDKFLSFTMVLGIAFLLLVSLVISAGISAADEYVQGLFPGSSAIIPILNQIVSFLLITALFAAIYKVLPDKDIQWQEVLVGAAFTAALFTLGKFLLGWYLGRSSYGSTYGAAGAFVLILVWIYYSAQLLLFGAEFTQVYARRYVQKRRDQEGLDQISPIQRTGIPERMPGDTAVTHVVSKPPLVENRRSLANMLVSMLVLVIGFVSATILGKTGIAK